MSSISILYFASYREILGVDKEIFELNPDTKTIADLKQQLMQRDGDWHTIFNDSTLVAINQNIAKNHSKIANGDEVAFFPPVTGG